MHTAEMCHNSVPDGRVNLILLLSV